MNNQNGQIASNPLSIETDLELTIMQHEREQHSQQYAMKRAHDKVKKQLDSDKLGETKVAGLMIEHALQSVLDRIKTEIHSATKKSQAGRPSVYQKSWKSLGGLDKSELESFVACGLSTIFDYAGCEGKYTACMFEIGKRAEHLVMMKEIMAESQEHYRLLKLRLSEKRSEKKRIDDISFTHRLHCIPHDTWDKKQILSCGVIFYEVAKEITGYFEDYNENEKTETIKHLRLTQDGNERLKNGINALIRNAKNYEPMITPPLPWTPDNFFHGCYLTASQPRVILVKSTEKNHLKNLSIIARNEAPDFLTAINSLQDTGWRIRKSVLNVIDLMFKAEEGHGVLPALKITEIPACPVCKDEAKKILLRWKIKNKSEESSTNYVNDRQAWILALNVDEQNLVNSYLAWKHESKLQHKENVRIRHQWIGLCRNVALAKDLSKFKAIYFPYQLDFRGRVYAVPQGLNPQGEDYVKALLEFDVGLPLGEHGWNWLLWHCANTWGEDKAGHENRVKWTSDNLGWIRECGQEPLCQRKWMEADKPWQFLACCIEINNALSLETPYKYVSHMPINMDGSCSGLQHIAMLTRCEATGSSVNLIHSDVPNDIYQLVADRVSDKLKKIAVSNDISNRVLANQWLNWKSVWSGGKLSRKITKRSVMTFAYGSSDHSKKVYDDILRDAYHIAIERARSQDLPLTDFIPWDRVNLRSAANFMGDLIGESLNGLIIKPVEFMTWMEAVAKVFNKAGLSMQWEAPSGFPVYHYYPKMASERVNWTLKTGNRLQITLKKATDGIDDKAQKRGAAPNLVHSLDAAHLCRTINLATEHSIHHFAVIHDSFGTHAANAGLLFEALRSEMSQLYSDDLLGDLHRGFIAQLPDELKGKCPAPPEWGSLDVVDVLNSPYAFS